MDKVVSKQNQCKRALEKQLDDIKVTQRQIEARRLREIRDLGVDLSRIQSASRPLEFIEDFTPRRYQPRRGSLPLAASGSGALNFESPRESRSRRRLSCIASIPLVSQDNEMSTAKKDQHRGSNKHDAQQSSPNSANVKASKEDSTDRSELATVPTSKASLAEARRGPEAVGIANRRGSDGGKSNNDGHNVTTVCVHEDKHKSIEDTTSSSDHTPEEESPSSPDMLRRRGRRASEPAVGGFFIRRLQANVYNDTQFVQQRSSVESAQLRRSIQKYLPSDIVAEEDEEEGDLKCISRSTEDITRHSSEKLESSLNTGKGLVSSSEVKSSKDIKIKDLSKEKTKTPKGNQVIAKSGSHNPSRARRSSDGDVLSYVSRKFHQERRVQGDNSVGNLRVTSAAGRNQNLSVEANDESDDVWQAVRKCRYLRGYDPPEMTEPANMREFVFGHGNIDSSPPESK